MSAWVSCAGQWMKVPSYYDGNGISNQGAVLFYKGIVPLFYDGFETGDETAWSASVP